MAFHFSFFGMILRKRREIMTLLDISQKHTNNFGDSHHNLEIAASETRLFLRIISRLW